jgi:hypothetical protein
MTLNGRTIYAFFLLFFESKERRMRTGNDVRFWVNLRWKGG